VKFLDRLPLVMNKLITKKHIFINQKSFSGLSGAYIICDIASMQSGNGNGIRIGETGNLHKRMSAYRSNSRNWSKNNQFYGKHFNRIYFWEVDSIDGRKGLEKAMIDYFDKNELLGCTLNINMSKIKTSEKLYKKAQSEIILCRNFQSICATAYAIKSHKNYMNSILGNLPSEKE
jgi:hypothetical protein